MQYLYQVLYNFWGFFFGGSTFTTGLSSNLLNTIEFLAVVSTIAVVMQIIVRPLFGLLPWSKRQ